MHRQLIYVVLIMFQLYILHVAVKEWSGKTRSESMQYNRLPRAYQSPATHIKLHMQYVPVTKPQSQPIKRIKC